MARGVLTVQQALKTGLALTMATPSTYTEGDSFVNDGNTCIYMTNSSTVITLTIATAATAGGYALADQAVTIASTDTYGKFVGPFDPKVFNREDGTVWLDFGAAATNIKIAVIRL